MLRRVLAHHHDRPARRTSNVRASVLPQGLQRRHSFHRSHHVNRCARRTKSCRPSGSWGFGGPPSADGALSPSAHGTANASNVTRSLGLWAGLLALGSASFYRGGQSRRQRTTGNPALNKAPRNPRKACHVHQINRYHLCLFTSIVHAHVSRWRSAAEVRVPLASQCQTRCWRVREEHAL